MDYDKDKILVVEQYFWCDLGEMLWGFSLPATVDVGKNPSKCKK
jgi:hypothetical protein